MKKFALVVLLVSFGGVMLAGCPKANNATKKTTTTTTNNAGSSNDSGSSNAGNS